MRIFHVSGLPTFPIVMYKSNTQAKKDKGAKVWEQKRPRVKFSAAHAFNGGFLSCSIQHCVIAGEVYTQIYISCIEGSQENTVFNAYYSFVRFIIELK